ncbi:MAG: hypothetical protein HY397_00400 [Candidatus Doudnabacteria bacterium]|nr:hypothetical protein [Candidatus Doudnabacteria bacterium]
MARKYLALLSGLALGAVYIGNPERATLFLFLLSILSALIAFGSFFIYRQQLSNVTDATFLIFPILWILASACVLFLLATPFWRFAVIVFGVAGLVKILLDARPKVITNLLENLFFLSAFGIYLGIWALDFYFTPGWWLNIILSAIASFVFFWAGFSATPTSASSRLIFSLVLSLLFAEIAWTMLFWPLHFLTLALVFSCLFYLAWSLTRFHLMQALTKEKLVVHSSFVVLTVSFLLIVSKWFPNT